MSTIPVLLCKHCLTDITGPVGHWVDSLGNRMCPFSPTGVHEPRTEAPRVY